MHWIIALCIIALLVIGWVMVDLGYYDPWYHDALSWHKSIGILVLLVVFLKILWRAITPMPQMQQSLARFEKTAAHLVHILLLVAMITIPISGYLISSSEGAAIDVFNWFSVPSLFTVSEGLRDTAIEIHYYCAYVTLVMVLLHAAAALKHQFIDHKDTLKRML